MQPVREVYSLLMPILDGRIIVPRAAVAEVTGYVRPKARPEGAPDFLLGFIDWQGQKIPLVSIEAASGRGVPEHDRRTRIAIVFGIAGRLDPDVFAVVTQGYPYLVRVNENVLQREDMKGDETLMLARVRMANEKPYIPDFEKLEALIAGAMGLAPANDGTTTDEPVDELEALGGDEEEFDAGISGVDEMPGEDALSFDAGDVAHDETEPDSGPDVDLGEVTSFGTETNYSVELDALSDALTTEPDAVEPPEVDGEPEISVDLDEVTVFGTETNYSVELDELSDALDTKEPAADDEYAVDLSALELDGDENADDLSAPAEDANTSSADDEYSIDLSGLELDNGENTEDAEPDEKPEEDAENTGEYDFSGLDLELDDDEEKKPE